MMTSGAGDTELRPSEWWARLQAPQHPWSVAPPPPKRPKRGKRKALLIAAVIITAAVVGGVVAIVLDSGSGGSAPAATAAPLTAVAPRSTVAGWQVVTNAVPAVAARSGSDGLVAVDVPSGWTVKPGISDGGVTQVQASVADGVCPGVPQSSRGAVTLMSDTATDQSKAVVNLVTAYLRDVGYANYHPQFTPAAPHPTTDGSFQDSRATVTLAPPLPPPGVPPPPGLPPVGCIPASVIVHVVARAHDGGTFAVIVAGDQQVGGAVAAADLDKIAATVRTPH